MRKFMHMTHLELNALPEVKADANDCYPALVNYGDKGKVKGPQGGWYIVVNTNFSSSKKLEPFYYDKFPIYISLADPNLFP